MKKLISLIVVALVALPAFAIAQEEPCPGEPMAMRPVVERSKERFHTVRTKKSAKKSTKKSARRHR